MFGVFIFAFSFFSESETLKEVRISEEFKVNKISDWKLRLVENKIYTLTKSSESKINKIDFFTLDSLNFANSASTKELAEKIIAKEIFDYKESKLEYSNGFLEYLKNHKSFSLEEVRFLKKDWFVYSLHNSERQTSVWVNVFTILGNQIFVFRFFYNIDSLEEIISNVEITNLLKLFIVENQVVNK
ncbi:MAG: hypothetical protein DWQ06_09515 [Calditrichaeota bacterium]|nr:MAG: hypothetical protein DWQ06_09515 [Calditrichota bacterium]